MVLFCLVSSVPKAVIPEWQLVLKNALPRITHASLKEAVRNIPLPESTSLDCDGLPKDIAAKLLQEINNIVQNGFTDTLDLIIKLFKSFSDCKITDPNSEHNKFQLNLATLIADSNRLNHILGNNNSINHRLVTLPWAEGEADFTVARESFMGASRAFSSNSDATYCLGLDQRNFETKPVVLGAVADGVSGLVNSQKYASGKIAANAVMKHIREHEAEFADTKNLASLFRDNTQLHNKLSWSVQADWTIEDLLAFIMPIPGKYSSLIVNNLEQVLRPGLKKNTTLLDLYLQQHNAQLVRGTIGLGLKPISGKNFNPGFNPRNFISWKNTLTRSVDKKMLEEVAERFFRSQNIGSILDLILVDNYKLALNAMKVLADSSESVVKAVNDTIPQGALAGLDEFSAAAALSLALDAGDKVMLISTGDTTACAFNDNGIITESVNQPHLTYHQNRIHLTSSIAAGLNSKKTMEAYPLSSLRFHITQVDKKDIKGLLLNSDGVIVNKPIEVRKANQEIFDSQNSDNLNPCRIIGSALRRVYRLGDDKSIVILSKGKHLVA